MAKDLIKERQKKYSDKDSTPVDMAQAQLDAARGLDEKSFLQTLTDPRSLMKLGLSAAALAAGSPEAAGLITGLDLLESPGEMAASKGAKSQAVGSATKTLMDAKQKEIDNELVELKSRRDLFGNNPQLYIAAHLLQDGATNAQLSNLLNFPDEFAWDRLDASRKSQEKLENYAAIIEKALAEADNEETATELTKLLIKTRIPGANLTNEEINHMIEMVGKGSVTLSEILGTVATKVTGGSQIDAQIAYAGGADPIQVLGNLKALLSPQELTNKDRAAQMALNEVFVAKTITKTNTDGTYDVLASPTITEAIGFMDDPEQKAIAQEMAESWGFAGTSQAEVKLRSDVYATQLAVMAEKNIMLKGLTLPELPATWAVDTTNELMRDSRALTMEANKSIAGGRLDSLRASIINNTGFAPGTDGYKAIRNKAIDRIRAKTTASGLSEAQIYEQAAALIATNKEDYTEYGAAAPGRSDVVADENVLE